MGILAKLSSFEMDEAILELYWRYMSELPPTLILEALEEAILDTGSKSMFPSAKRLRSYVDPVVSIDDRGDQIARLISSCITKHGYNWPQKDRSWPSEAITELGKEGWEVVSRVGGWIKVHQESCVMDQGHFHAQIKKTAISTLRALEKEAFHEKRIELSDGRPKRRDLPSPVPRIGEHGES